MGHGIVRRIASVSACAATLCGSACGHDGRPPTAPSAPAPTYEFSRINGYVSDTALRPLPGVAVQILDGARSGQSTVSDASGEFVFSNGPYGSNITYQLSKNGYVRARVTGPLSYGWPSASARLGVVLESTDPPARIEPGDYTMTWIADSTCVDIPADLRTRSYAATIEPLASGASSYGVRVNGLGRFGPGGVGIGVAGRDLALRIDEGLLEEIPGRASLGWFGSASTTVTSAIVSAIEFRVDGALEYCAMRSGVAAPYSCGPAESVLAHSLCWSRNLRMTLVHR